jgi:hypothetical protein
MIDLYEQYNEGIRLRDAERLDAAWGVFFSTLHLTELMIREGASINLYKLQFDLLCEIAKIQKEKDHLQAADTTYITAEALRVKYLGEADIPPIEHVGLLKWQNDFDQINELVAEDQHYAVLAMARDTAAEIEAINDSAKSRNHWRLLMKIYDIISNSYTVVDEPEKAVEYDEKAEDIAFVRGFDRCEQSDE